MYTEVQKGKIGTTFRVFLIEVRKDTSEDFLYMDEVYIGKNPTNVDEGTHTWIGQRKLKLILFASPEVQILRISVDLIHLYKKKTKRTIGQGLVYLLGKKMY